MLGFAARKKDNIICTELIITVDNTHKFTNQEIVEKMLITKNIITDSCIIDKLNFDEIEELIELDPFVKEAQVFSNFKGQLFISINQRNPVMRIITKDNESYYVDDECKLMPVCNYYSANVIAVTGQIDNDFINPGLAPKLKNDTISGDVTLSKLYDFVNYINENELWRSQFEQIYITEEMEAELVPRVGNHIIVLGNLENFEYKLGKLEALYKKGFALTDWNIYYSINLKYSDQVICKKR
jgi:cell division protein FtsQ